MNISTSAATRGQAGRSPSPDRSARLSRAEELRLVARVQAGDERAVRELLSAHRRLAWDLAARYGGWGLSAEDLVQDAYIGLWVAALRFDARRGTRFVSYGWHWARKHVLRAVRGESQLVRLPHRLWDQRRVMEVRVCVTGFPPDLVGDQSGASGHRADRAQAIVDDVLELLSAREREIVRWRFQFDDAVKPQPRAGRREVSAVMCRVRRLVETCEAVLKCRKESNDGEE